MPPVLLGIAIIGGAIVLITSAFSDEDESANKNNEEGKASFDAEEVRRLRRQLKKQMRLKKKNSTEK